MGEGVQVLKMLANNRVDLTAGAVRSWLIGKVSAPAAGYAER
jgi:hypothetical protein